VRGEDRERAAEVQCSRPPRIPPALHPGDGPGERRGVSAQLGAQPIGGELLLSLRRLLCDLKRNARNRERGAAADGCESEACFRGSGEPAEKAIWSGAARPPTTSVVRAMHQKVPLWM
jgi:hypothetical protein